VQLSFPNRAFSRDATRLLGLLLLLTPPLGAIRYLAEYRAPVAPPEVVTQTIAVEQPIYIPQPVYVQQPVYIEVPVVQYVTVDPTAQPAPAEPVSAPDAPPIATDAPPVTPDAPTVAMEAPPAAGPARTASDEPAGEMVARSEPQDESAEAPPTTLSARIVAPPVRATRPQLIVTEPPAEPPVEVAVEPPVQANPGPAPEPPSAPAAAPTPTEAQRALASFYEMTEREWSARGYSSADEMREELGNSQTGWLKQTIASAGGIPAESGPPATYAQQEQAKPVQAFEAEPKK
jgi:hypothetical protein